MKRKRDQLEREQRAKAAAAAAPLYARGALIYKKKEERAAEGEEETKQQPPGAYTTSQRVKWEKKEDVLRRLEEAEQKKERREQLRTRKMLDRIFRKVGDGGITEDQLEQKVVALVKSTLLRTVKRNIGRRSGPRKGRGDVTVSEEAEQRMAKEAKTAAGDVLEAMRGGFLATEYEVELDASAQRTYRKKTEETSDVELDAEAAKEVDAMAERFHAFGSGSSFKLGDVRTFFQSADEGLLRKLCHDLKHDIFEDLFTVTKELSSGEFLFVKKPNAP